MTGPGPARVDGDDLVLEFAVRASPAHAFDTWTRRPALWWPGDHTATGAPADIVFEPRPGGRIFERSTAGVEVDWGTVLDWRPPYRLRYRWHLFFTPAEATEVEVSFTAVADGTAVRLVHRGWQRLGTAGPPRRGRTGQVWTALATAYQRACAPPGTG